MALSADTLHADLRTQVEAQVGTTWEPRLQGTDGRTDSSGILLCSPTLDFEEATTSPGDRVQIDGQTVGIVGVAGHELMLAAPVTDGLEDQVFLVETQVAVDFGAGGADPTLQALAAAVVEEITGYGKAAVETDTLGVSTNTLLSPGTYTGVGTAASTGGLSGLSGSRLAAAIKAHLEGLLGTLDFAAGRGNESIDAIAEALVAEIADHARITATTTDTGTVPAGGGPVSGSGSGTGIIDSLDADRLHADLKTAILQKTPQADLSGRPDRVLKALAVAVVDHLQASAQVAVTVELDITAPPAGGPAAGSGEETDGPVS